VGKNIIVYRKVLSWGSLKQGEHIKDGSIILKWIIKRWEGMGEFL
jgi:hypothetical protein